jgi:hypothetical protein
MDPINFLQNKIKTIEDKSLQNTITQSDRQFREYGLFDKSGPISVSLLKYLKSIINNDENFPKSLLYILNNEYIFNTSVTISFKKYNDAFVIISDRCKWNYNAKVIFGADNLLLYSPNITKINKQIIIIEGKYVNAFIMQFKNIIFRRVIVDANIGKTIPSLFTWYTCEQSMTEFSTKNMVDYVQSILYTPRKFRVDAHAHIPKITSTQTIPVKTSINHIYQLLLWLSSDFSNIDSYIKSIKENCVGECNTCNVEFEDEYFIFTKCCQVAICQDCFNMNISHFRNKCPQCFNVLSKDSITFVNKDIKFDFNSLQDIKKSFIDKSMNKDCYIDRTILRLFNLHSFCVITDYDHFIILKTLFDKIVQPPDKICTHSHIAICDFNDILVPNLKNLIVFTKHNQGIAEFINSLTDCIDILSDTGTVNIYHIKHEWPND